MGRRGRAIRKLLLAMLICLAIGAVSQPAQARTPFEQGKVRLSALITTANAFDARYVVLGLGLGFFVLDGLEVGADIDFWLGAGAPFIFVATPQVRYIWAVTDYLAPYLGTFYRHWFITGSEPDIDSLGGRLGLYILPQGPALLGLGLAYERIINDCDEECGRFYPEIQVSVLF